MHHPCRRFDRGALHCSPPTARLVQQQLRVLGQRIRPHPLNQPFEVEGVRVTFIDANHCPGAVMALFEPPLGAGARPVLHTGDCRLVPAMQQEAALQVCWVLRMLRTLRSPPCECWGSMGAEVVRCEVLYCGAL